LYIDQTIERGKFFPRNALTGVKHRIEGIAVVISKALA